MRAFLHFTGLEELPVHGCRGITSDAMAQIQPGSWLKLTQLDVNNSQEVGDDPLVAINGLLNLTGLRMLDAYCNNGFATVVVSYTYEDDSSGEPSSQIKPGDWPQLQKLSIANSNLSEIKGLGRD
jgi:hypothetical protein